MTTAELSGRRTSPRLKSRRSKDSEGSPSESVRAVRSPSVKSKAGRSIEEKLDNEVVYEFGGPIGVTFMMLFFPCLMYYFWVCLEYYDGALQYPKSVNGVVPWVQQMVDHVKRGAAPTVTAAVLYVGFALFQAVLSFVMPGVWVKGLPVPSEGYKQLDYLCNGISAWYVTLGLAGTVQYFGVFDLSRIIDEFGPLLTVSIIFGNVVTWITYFATITWGKPHRMSGNFLYDLFMGAPLNPRIGHLDLKMYAEIRVPWTILFFLSLSALVKQYKVYGYVTPELCFMTLAHFLYVNACMKGEECIPTTWDIFYEKWGYMLIFWNFSGVPFTYIYSTIYLTKHEPLNHSTPYYALCFSLLLVGYYIWDTANSQKNRFRMQERGTYIPRYTFPQLPWGTLENPTYVQTKQGSKLLTGGWWGYARKIHYTADLMMALSWGLITGFNSFIPYFYVTFFVAVLIHRVSRDVERCSKKYGEDWEEYVRQVPWIFIPYVF